jgi:RNA polymerase sigma factor (sigma-70 family)
MQLKIKPTMSHAHNCVYVLPKNLQTPGKRTTTVDPYAFPEIGTVPHQVSHLYSKYQVADTIGRNAIGKKIMTLITPDFYRVIRSSRVPRHLQDDAMGEAMSSLAHCLVKYPTSMKREKVSFLYYTLAIARVYIQRFVEREMRHAKHRSMAMGSEEGAIAVGIGTITDEIGREVADDEIELSYETALDDAVLEQILRMVLSSDGLDARAKEIFEMYYFKDMPMQAICSAKDLNPQIVTRCIDRGLKMVKKALHDAQKPM